MMRLAPATAPTKATKRFRSNAAAAPKLLIEWRVCRAIQQGARVCDSLWTCGVLIFLVGQWDHPSTCPQWSRWLSVMEVLKVLAWIGRMGNFGSHRRPVELLLAAAQLVGHVLYYFDHHGEGPEGACYGSAVHKATFWTIVMHDTAVAVIAFLPILTFLILTVVDHFAPVQNRHVYVNGALPEELRELAVERVNASMCGHDDASCEICLDDYEEGEELRLLPCRHHFHQSCVDEWLGKVPSCPKCQGTIYEEPMSTADGDHEKTE